MNIVQLNDYRKKQVTFHAADIQSLYAEKHRQFLELMLDNKHRLTPRQAVKENAFMWRYLLTLFSIGGGIVMWVTW